MGSLQKHTQANIGWGISALCKADNNTTAQVAGGVAVRLVVGGL